MKIYTVYDNKAKYYMNPYTTTSRGEALRQFIAACSDDQHPFCKFADSFTLIEIGEFDHENGVIEPYDIQEPIANAWELKDRFKPVDDRPNPFQKVEKPNATQ